MNPIFAFGSADDLSLVAPLFRSGVATPGRWESRSFPDGESYLRIDDDVRGRSCMLVARLDRPDAKLTRLAFAADTLRELGATHLHMVAPYLPYMRQDERFRPGECVSSRLLARWFGERFDAITTVDPHLHRLPTLSAAFPDVDARAVSSAPALAEWIGANVPGATIVGPDEEAEQWARPVADALGAPLHILDKVRHGDRDVVVSGASAHTPLAGRDVVLIDDIISTGTTLARAAEALRDAGARVRACVCVHALFAPGATETLQRAGIDRIVSTNSALHETNAIDLSDRLSSALEAAIRGR